MGVSSTSTMAASGWRGRRWLWSLLATRPGRRLLNGVLVVVALALNGPGDPLGGQFQVNSYTTSHQQRPGVAMDDGGDFVVVWESNGSGEGDTAGYSIQGQRYDSAGVPQGNQFQVNTFTASDQRYPEVAMDSNGAFVVVWQSLGEDGSGESVQGRRYDSAGVAQGSPFQVNGYTTGGQMAPAVAMDDDGDFVVVWHSDGSPFNDGSGRSVQGQRYDAAGVAQGANFQVNTYTSSQQRFPAVAMDGDGDFVVVWESYGSAGGDTNGFSVQGQRYNSAGTAQGGQFQVNTYTTSQQDRPAVGMDADGEFVVVWMSEGAAGGDTAGYSIQGRRYNSVGTAQGGQFQVNSYTGNDQQFPAVAMDGAGNFAVSWQSNGSAGGDNNALSVQEQRFDAAGVALGNEWQVNSYTLGNQQRPFLGMDGDGDFVVVWQSTGSPGDDAAGESVQGQRFAGETDPTAIGWRTAEAEGTHGDSGLLLMAAGVAAGLMALWLRWRRKVGS